MPHLMTSLLGAVLAILVTFAAGWPLVALPFCIFAGAAVGLAASVSALLAADVRARRL
ncbi:MAG: hypothetical protein AAF092_08160 [Pseudomonadota bacterium]